MVKDTQRKRTAKGSHRVVRDGDSQLDQPPSADLQATRAQRARAFTRSVFEKGAHDTLAKVVGAVFITSTAGLLYWIGGQYGYEIDLRGWISSGKPIISNSFKTPAPPADPDIVDKLVACRVKRQREIDRLIDRRKYAWSLYSKCKSDWKPVPNSAQTTEEACAADLVRHRALAQEVMEREAKDECAAPSKK